MSGWVREWVSESVLRNPFETLSKPFRRGVRSRFFSSLLFPSSCAFPFFFSLPPPRLCCGGFSVGSAVFGCARCLLCAGCLFEWIIIAAPRSGKLFSRDWLCCAVLCFCSQVFVWRRIKFECDSKRAMGDEIDEDAAWEAAHGVDDDAGWQPGGGSDSEEEEELFGTAAIKLKQQQQEDAMWAEINAEFDFTQDRVEDFALKSLTIAEQNFGFRVPDPDLDFTEEFEGSVKKVRGTSSVLGHEEIKRKRKRKKKKNKQCRVCKFLILFYSAPVCVCVCVCGMCARAGSAGN